MTFDEADAVPDPFELRQPMLFKAPGIRAIIDPRNLEYGVLRRADVFVLRMIRDSWPERPIYFARSAVGYPHSLGLGEQRADPGARDEAVRSAADAQRRERHGVRAGRRLARRRAIARAVDDVFHGPQSVVDEGQWVDRPSASMPAMYIFLGRRAHGGAARDGQVAEARRGVRR